MPSIFFQEALPFDELAALSQELPHYDIMTECASSRAWSLIEVLYGNRLDEQQLASAARLRWIHCPTADTDALCMTEIQKRGILVTLSKGQNVPQMAEFVIGGVLSFAKQFFHWPKVSHEPAEFWDWPLKETVWSMQKRILLQVGLGEVGSAVAKMANALGMKTWGVRRQPSFHPDCKKIFPLSNFHPVLPVVDVVVAALPKTTTEEIIFGAEEFNLMKRDSIFIVVGWGGAVDEEALAKIGKTGKFRGILLDAYSRPPPPKDYPLWDVPNAILTPSVASYPISEERMAFRLFRRNLRVYSVGKINEMKNLVL